MKFQDDAPSIVESHVQSWTISSSSDEKNQVIEGILRALADRATLTPSQMFKYRLCMDEALTNAITHGSAGVPDAQVSVDLFWAESSWVIRVLDSGEGFVPKDVPDLSEPGQEFQERGRGILIMERYCEDLIYSSGGSEVTIRMKMDTVTT